MYTYIHYDDDISALCQKQKTRKEKKRKERKRESKHHHPKKKNRAHKSNINAMRIR